MAEIQPAIAVHGGAGRVPDTGTEPHLRGCRQALDCGYRILQEGGKALDAVQAAVTVLEDNPLFNAGLGAPLNAVGEVELDASIMDGATLRAGAVGAVQGIKNPVGLARNVLEHGRHVLLVADGAEDFARRAGMEEIPKSAQIIDAQRQRWREVHGTVGCVALDTSGHTAAATSTGGIFDKLPGRVGDSALIGCGTYADATGAVSCTGVGENIIQVVLARAALDLLRHGFNPQEAARRAVAMLEQQTGGEAGLIIVDRTGAMASAHNAACMLRGFAGGDAVVSVQS